MAVAPAGDEPRLMQDGQVLGDALWGIAGQYLPSTVAIALAAAAGALAAAILRPQPGRAAS